MSFMLKLIGTRPEVQAPNPTDEITVLRLLATGTYSRVYLV
jgi:hypothetical protein